MLWNAKSGQVVLDNDEMSFVSFGYGKKSLIIVPGLSDGLTTVKGKAIALAAPYNLFFKKYTVYIFSRKNNLSEIYTIRQMAADQASAMHKLGIEKASVLGISEGGMIAQYLAIDSPELVEKLIVASSSPKANETVCSVVKTWVELAQQGKHRQLMIDIAEKSYSERYLCQFRMIYPIIGMIGKPASYTRFLSNANAILNFDVSDDLKNISCPTLILAGGKDKIVGVESSHELHRCILHSELYIYPRLGHAIYEEASDFNQHVYNFLIN